jgi:hypothetical protein
VDWSAELKVLKKVFTVILSVINFLFFALNILFTIGPLLDRSGFQETAIMLTFFASIFAMLFSVIPAVFVRHWINWTVFILNILIFIIQQIFLFHNYSY